MADNTPIKTASNTTINAATAELSDGAQSPKVTLLAGTGSTTPISPATSGRQTQMIDLLALTVPTDSAGAITPHNSTNLASTTRAVFVGTGGNLVAIIGGAAVTFANVPDGTILPIRATRVNATGTTAADLVALY